MKIKISLEIFPNNCATTSYTQSRHKYCPRYSKEKNLISQKGQHRGYDAAYTSSLPTKFHSPVIIPSVAMQRKRLANKVIATLFMFGEKE